jgi:hypothetical protein
MTVLISRRRIQAVARLDAKGQASLFDIQDLTSAGIWPLRAFDPEADMWLAEYARARGLDPVHIEEQIRRQLAAQLGKDAVGPEALETSGIGWKIGGWWAVDPAAVDRLLEDRAPDMEAEATAADLVRELMWFDGIPALIEALRSAGVPYRISKDEGRRVSLFDRRAALYALGGDTPSLGMTAAPVDSLRTTVGPFVLRAGVSTPSIRWFDATALLVAGGDARELYSAVTGEDAPIEGAPIDWLEAHLVAAGDMEGLLLLASIVDGRLTLDRDEGRTAAILRLLKNQDSSLF